MLSHTMKDPFHSTADRIRGCLIGIATGDAIGKQTEMLSHEEIANWYPGGVRGFEGQPGDVIPRYAGNSKHEWRIGETTDDTERTVAVARALLLDPPALIMDEPTNALDNRSEESFKSKLEKALPGKTFMLVTHRASLLSLVPRLIVLDGGRIVADGPKEQVMQALSGGKISVAKR